MDPGNGYRVIGESNDIPGHLVGLVAQAIPWTLEMGVGGLGAGF